MDIFAILLAQTDIAEWFKVRIFDGEVPAKVVKKKKWT